MRADKDSLRRNWWALAVRGAVAGLFGLFALTRPTTSFIVIVALFGAWWLIDGALTIVAALFAAERRERWWPLVAEGMVSVALGAALYLVPGITVTVLLYLVAAWAIATGAFRVVAAIRLRNAIDSEWLLGTTGVLAILFGLLVLVSPESGAIALTIAVGVFALLYGIMLMVLSARLYAINDEQSAHAERHHPQGGVHMG